MLLHAVEDGLREGLLNELVRRLVRAGDPERTIGRALGRHGSVLAANPTLTLPCVYQLCWFDGSEPLRQVLLKWIAEWKALGRGRWLRALRAPHLGLDASIVSEYRGPEGSHRPWFSVSGDVVGLREATSPVLAWDRASGKIDSSAVPPTDPSGYEIDHLGRRFGILALRSESGGAMTIPIDDDVSLSHVVTLPNGDVIAGGWIDDYLGVILRVRPRDGAVVWRREFGGAVSQLALAPDTSRVVVSDGRATHIVIGCEHGNELSAFVSTEGQVALSPDNRHLAVWSGTALRIWAASSGHQVVHDSGLEHAAFSADGSRLLCGSRFYDGRSGALVARVEVERSGYLEGGPAPGCTRVLDDGLVEANLFHGFRQWNASGELLSEDPNRRYGMHRHTLAIATSGMHYAVGPSTTQTEPIELRRLSGELIRHLGHRSKGTMLWSPDSTWLANISADGDIFLNANDGAEVFLGPHPDAKELYWSVDNAMLASRGEQEEKLWSVGANTLVDERPTRGNRQWEADLSEWNGFRAQVHSRRGALRGGLFEVVDNGRRLAAIPSDESLNSSPTGEHFAGRYSHYVLEGGSE